MPHNRELLWVALYAESPLKSPSHLMKVHNIFITKKLFVRLKKEGEKKRENWNDKSGSLFHLLHFNGQNEDFITFYIIFALLFVFIC